MDGLNGINAAEMFLSRSSWWKECVDKREKLVLPSESGLETRKG
jgi:hypothetical protein